MGVRTTSEIHECEAVRQITLCYLAGYNWLQQPAVTQPHHPPSLTHIHTRTTSFGLTCDAALVTPSTSISVLNVDSKARGATCVCVSADVGGWVDQRAGVRACAHWSSSEVQELRPYAKSYFVIGPATAGYNREQSLNPTTLPPSSPHTHAPTYTCTCHVLWSHRRCSVG